MFELNSVKSVVQRTALTLACGVLLAGCGSNFTLTSATTAAPATDTTGSTGSTGTTGSTGSTDTSGSTGSTDTSGSTGSTNTSGSTGSTNTSGSTDTSGSTGTSPSTDTSTGASYFVATNGSDSAAGTQAQPWATIAHAQDMMSPGDTAYFRSGTYAYTAATTACASQTDKVSAITLSKSGSDGKLLNYIAYPGEKPVFDFSGMTDDCRIKGFNITGSYIHLKGLEVTGVRQNNNLNHESWGIWISGSYNTFEQLDTHHHMGPGLFIQNGSYNLVLNTDSHHNYDPYTSNGAGQSADGFGVHISANNPGNVIRGCRAWWNSDDGFDVINAYSPVLIENSWAWFQGYLPDTMTPAVDGNGNGFKVGGYGGVYDAGAVKHTVRFSVAFANKANGFYSNHHPIANDFFNNTSYANKVDFNMLGIDANGAAVNLGTLRNNVAYSGTLTSNMTGADDAYNSWSLGLTIADTDFVAVSTTGWDAARQADGSLPVLTTLRPSISSVLIDKGTNIGNTYVGAAPDLGAYELSN